MCAYILLVGIGGMGYGFEGDLMEKILLFRTTYTPHPSSHLLHRKCSEKLLFCIFYIYVVHKLCDVFCVRCSLSLYEYVENSYQKWTRVLLCCFFLCDWYRPTLCIVYTFITKILFHKTRNTVKYISKQK